MNKAGLSWWVGFFLICLVQFPDVHAVTLWKSHYYYRAGSLVSHNSDDSLIKYRAIKPSKNRNPAQYPDYWKPVSVISGKNQIPEDETAIETGSPVPPAIIVPPSEDVFSDSQVVTEEIGSPNLPDIRLESPALIDTGSPLIPDTTPQNTEMKGAERHSAASEWDAKVFYLAGELTRYKEALYQARWSNSSMTPGKTDVWMIFNEPGIHHQWQRDHIYPVPGLRVLHSGYFYENTNWTLNDEPGKAAVWNKMESADYAGATPWDGSKSYGTGDLVRYGDILYRSRWHNQNQMPGRTDVWVIVFEEGKQYYWKQNHVYPVPGNRVIHKDNIYVNSSWTRGDEPGVAPVWTLTGASDAIADWNSDKQYPIDERVRHDQRYYKSVRENRNEEPGQSDSWSLSDHDGTIYPWIRNHTYPVAGVKVSYLGNQYQNTGWTRGDLPGESSKWEMVVASGNGDSVSGSNSGSGGSGGISSGSVSVNCYSPIESGLSFWQPQSNYVFNDKVKHTHLLDGSNYTLTFQSRWSINPGEEPGLNQGWVLLLAEDALCPWSPYYTYSDADNWTTVFHKGKVYRRKFWTLNEEPGTVIEGSAWDVVQ